MKEKGVSLVEIIISMLILSLILLGIAGIFVAGKRYLKRTQYKQEALNLAREKLEALEALDFDDEDLQTVPTTHTRIETETLSNGWPRTWTITDTDEHFNPIISPEPDYKRITLTVEWSEP